MQNGVQHLGTNAQLKGLIFCHPRFLSLNGQEASFESLFHTEELKAGIVPQLSELQATLAIPTLSAEQVPTCFGSSPSEEMLPWHLHPGFEELSNAIHYSFSDGKVINAREILYHEYCAGVPQSLLPLSSNLIPDLESHQKVQFHLFDGLDYPEWGGLKQAELILVSILVQASHHDSIPIWISSSMDRDHSKTAARLKKILVKTEGHAQWYLESIDSGKGILKFLEHPFTPGGKLLQNLEVNRADQILIFHPYAKTVDLICRKLYPKYGVGKTFDEWILEQSSQSNGEIRIPLSGHSTIDLELTQIDTQLKAENLTLVQRPETSIVSDDTIDHQLWIEKDGTLRFCRSFDLGSSNFQIWNLPKIATYYLKGLNGGLGSLTDIDVKEVAQDRRGLKRDRDLKVLKHTGMFALILLESIHYASEKKTFEGKSLPSLEEFHRSLFSKLGVLLYEVEKRAGFVDLSPAPSLDKVCSKNVIDLIHELTKRSLRDFTFSEDIVFTKNKELVLQQGMRPFLHILHSLLSRIAIESLGQCFLKPRFNAFTQFLKHSGAETLQELQVYVDQEPDPNSLDVQRYSPVSTWISTDQILSCFLPLHRKGFHLYYDGLPLNEMDTADFQPVFELKEDFEPGDQKSPSQNIDWFELHPKFFFKGVEVESNKLDRLAREGVLEFQGRIYLIQNKNMPSIKRLEAFWAKIQTGKMSDSKRKSADRYLRLPKSQTLEMLALRASGVTVTGGKRWKKICEFFDSLTQSRSSLDIPKSVNADLKSYQKTGVQWLLDLYDLGLGGILADDMGLGKTIQTLSFLEILRGRKDMGSTLILVPTSLTYNWISEASKFTPDIPTFIFQSKVKDQAKEFLNKNPNAALISTYGLFTEHQDFFSNHNWNILIFDEAQNLKNIASKRTTASRRVSAKFKLCLTGTPLENHLGEFYSLLDLVVSGCLGELSSYREKFISPDTINKADLQFLKLKAKPLVLRRTKAEILSELPPKQESTIKLPFEQKQERIYRDIALSWNEKVKGSILSDGEAKSQLLMLTALLRLRQACSDPGSIPNVRYDEEPPKITVLMEALQEITESGESALVFTQFLQTFDRIKKELKKNQIETYSLHGGTTRVERERVLKSFQESKKGSVLLMTLKTGGVGLNLIKASYVFHLEPWWNPAVENQATDRAHRIGQQRPVQVYRYLMRESVEEKIEILKSRKSAKFNALFSSTEKDAEVSAGGAALSQADFEYLLS